MNVKEINELMELRAQMQSRLVEINNSIAELANHSNQFYNNIKSNSERLTSSEQIEKICTFNRAYTEEKQSLNKEKKEIERKISFNNEMIAGKSRISAQEYALLLRKVLHKNGFDYTTRFVPISINRNNLDNWRDVKKLPYALTLLTNPDEYIIKDGVNDQKIIIATLLSDEPDFAEKQAKLIHMQVPVIEADSEREKLIVDAKVKIPTFKLNIDGGAGTAYNTGFGNWLADAVREELGIISTNKKIETPTM